MIELRIIRAVPFAHHALLALLCALATTANAEAGKLWVQVQDPFDKPIARNEALYAAGTNAETRDSNYENGRQPFDDKLAPAQCPYIAYAVCITRATPWRELERSSTSSWKSPAKAARSR
jgi:hypothetical protein